MMGNAADPTSSSEASSIWTARGRRIPQNETRAARRTVRVGETADAKRSGKEFVADRCSMTAGSRWLAVVLGGEISAEAEREAAAQAGHPAAKESAEQLNRASTEQINQA